MSEELAEELVIRAVQRAFDDWAVEHPSLAAVIDRITLTEHAARSLRESAEYRSAVSEYHKGQSQLGLLEQLTELAGGVLGGILTA